MIEEIIKRWLYVNIARFLREQFGIKLHYRQRYQEYLIGPRWFLLRAIRQWWDGLTCVDCGSRVGLQCHHVSYASKGRIFFGELADLRTVCSECHQRRHA